MPFEITSHDIFIVLFLAFLEGILSIDNALVLAMLAKHLPKHLQQKALTYGLIGAVVFRLIALALATYIIKFKWVQFLGGGYLVFIALKHFIKGDAKKDNEKDTSTMGFWKVVILIELTDIAFAVDSILAAIALTKKFWIIFAGGMIGVILMRIAAKQLITILDKFPKLEDTAYQLVLLIGLKVIFEGFHMPGVDFHSAANPAFWIFWALMGLVIAVGLSQKKKDPGEAVER